MSREKAIKLFREFMVELGIDVNDPEFSETPRRVYDMYKALIKKDEAISRYFKRTLPTKHHEMITFNGIPFVGVCPHHLQLYVGKTYIAYIPNGKIVGFSKFSSAVKELSRVPQLQETFTSKLADTIHTMLEPIGTMVVVKAMHMCTAVPGVYDYNCGVVETPTLVNVTSALRGLFLHEIEGQPWSSAAARNEALQLMGLQDVWR